MHRLFNDKKLQTSSGTNKLPLKCEVCGSVFHRKAKDIKHAIKNNYNYFRFCSRKCNGTSQKDRVTISCSNCNLQFEKIKSQIKKSKSGNCFCSKSCAAQYNNTHKTKGIRRSKLEIWIESKLSKDYPELKIYYNKTEAINSELDIYFPDLKLAVELNGIFHYEPIYGKEKLASIKNNDNRKFQACLECGIELLIIDTSSLKYFKPKNAQKYYDVISNILSHRVP